MKRFSCGAVIDGCTATFEADNDDELFASIATHAAEAHGITDLTPELVDTVRGFVVTVDS